MKDIILSIIKELEGDIVSVILLGILAGSIVVAIATITVYNSGKNAQCTTRMQIVATTDKAKFVDLVVSKDIRTSLCGD